MTIRVNYTQRGFRDDAEYRGFTGFTEEDGYDPQRITHTIIRCRSCWTSDPNAFSIEHIEARDLADNPIVCGNCGDKNIQVEYFKPDVLPRLYVDENHAHANMYNDTLELWENGGLHPSFKFIIDMLKHPAFYYGSQNEATYLDPDGIMMNGTAKDADGNPLTWKDYPWVDIKLMVDPPINTDDPEVIVEPLPAVEPVPNSTFLENFQQEDATNGDIYWTIPDFRTFYKLMGLIEDTVTDVSGRVIGYYAYFPQGLWFDWERDITEEELMVIERWELDTGSTHPRRGLVLPAEDFPVLGDEGQPIDHYSWNNVYNRGKRVWSIGDMYEGLEGVDLTLKNVKTDCDYINDDPDIPLPGISADMQSALKKGFDIPPIPLYVNNATGEGSVWEEDPLTGEWISGTGYSAAEITYFKTYYTWVETTNVPEREGSKYKRHIIKGHNHMLRNRLVPTPEDCNPGLSFNNGIYTCKFFFITQVDLDNPIY